MTTNSTSRLALVFALSAGASALATVLVSRPRRPALVQQAATGGAGASLYDSRRELLRGSVRENHPDAFTPQLSLQADIS